MGSVKPGMSLREIQDRFQAAVLSGDDAALCDIMDSSRTGRDVLFGVYRNAYASRLAEIIGQDHDALKAYLGDEEFDAMARAYISTHPSQTQNARWFSTLLPAFLQQTEPYRDYPQIADLAQIEASLNTAFDAADGPVIGLPDVASIPPEAWSILQFEPQSSATRFNIQSNAFDIWRALKDEADPPEPSHFDAPVSLLVWRQKFTPMIRQLGTEEAMLWNEASKGVKFGDLCEMAAAYDPGDPASRVANLLAGWLSAGLLSHVG